MKKYELLEPRFDGFMQIRALRDIPRYCVQKGDLGGWVKSEKNLSQEGDCWVADDAHVFGYAIVEQNAIVRDRAWIFYKAHVSGFVCIAGRAMIGGTVKIFGELIITGETIIQGNARIC